MIVQVALGSEEDAVTVSVHGPDHWRGEELRGVLVAVGDEALRMEVLRSDDGVTPPGDASSLTDLPD